jgi:S2P endopeptidase
MATLSLYLFNLLPLPFLDGTQLLDAMLDFVFDSYFFCTSGAPEEIDLGALEGGVNRGAGGRGRRSGHGRWKHFVGKMVRSGTTGLCVGCIGLGIINWMVVR